MIQSDTVEDKLPLAYAEGFAWWGGRQFSVDPRVLIPRPETEVILEMASAVGARQILDLCTGSGVLAVSLALAAGFDLSGTQIVASDISEEALAVAQMNAEKFGANVEFVQSDLFDGLVGQKFDLIVSNPPYVDENWEWLDLQALGHEPAIALFAEDEGLSVIKKILLLAADFLNDGGRLLLEADPVQHEKIIEFAHKKTRLQHEKTNQYILQFWCA